MFRQMGIGAAAVLSIGLLAAGCSDDGSDTILLAGGELNNNDNSSLTTISSNNLAPDGGGLSQNDADVREFAVTFNCDCCGSDGTFSGDNSAIVLFEVQDGNGAGDFRIYGCHFDGSTLSPPVELFGDDRDDTKGVNLSSFVCIPMNTSGYQASSSTTGVAATQANDGNWLILGAAQTLFQDPVINNTTGGGNMTTTNARGKRWALYSWRFVKANRDVPTGSLTYNAITETFRYGFEETGDIVNTTFQGGGATANNVPTSAGNSPLAVPPNHVTSYGFVSDTLCGQARFGGNSLPFSPTAAGAVAYGHIAGANAATSTAFGYAIPRISNNNANQGMDSGAVVADFLGYRTPSYTVGESTSYITAVWTQVCNSFSGGGSFTSSGTGGTHAGGHELQLRSRGFDMANMVWEANEAEIVEPAARNANTTNLRAGTAPFPTFYVSNNFLYFKYADASLAVNHGTSLNQNLLGLVPLNGAGNDVDWFQDETGGHEGGRLKRTTAAQDRTFWEEIIAVQRFVDDGDGTSSPSGAVVDLSSDTNTRTGTASHTLTNPTVVTNGRDIYPADREIANFNGSGQSILGPDGGNAEYSLFYVMADNSNTTGNVNIDSELCVVVHDTAGAFVAGTNPNRISGTSVADFHSGVLNGLSDKGGNAQSLLEDPIVPNGTQGTVAAAGGNGTQGSSAGAQPTYTSTGYGPTYFSLCVNRTGTWAGIAYKKDTGASSGAVGAGSFHQGLFVTFYQPFRTVSGTTGTGTAANVDVRTTAAMEVNSTGLTPATYTPGNRADAGGIAGALPDSESFRNWDNFPVNSYAWQGKLGYRCGMQSNANVVSLFFEQSDATSDRVWGRQMTVTVGATGTPTVAFTGAAAELDASDAIASHASHTRVNGTTTVNGASTFPFIDKDGTATNLRTCDSGVDVAGATGQVLVVYRKIVDNTTTDGDLADAQVRAVVWSGTAFGTSTAIDTRTNENAAVEPSTGNNNNTNPTNSSNDNVAGSATVTAPAGNPHTSLVCTPNNQDIASLPSYPTVAGEVSITIFMTDKEATTTATGGVNTVSTNASRRLALYARKWTPVVTGTTALDVAGRILPTTTGDVQPVQADHDGGASDDVTSISTFQNGGTIGALFETENQLWVNVTTDGGVTFFQNGTSSNPALLSNNSAEDVLAAPAFRFFPCTDANGDVTNGILLFAKNDRDNDARLHLRAGNMATN